jgi:hypothetical protein
MRDSIIVVKESEKGKSFEKYLPYNNTLELIAFYLPGGFLLLLGQINLISRGGLSNGEHGLSRLPYQEQLLGLWKRERTGTAIKKLLVR